ncbi:cohesin subunit SA-2 isoform X1 [Etheostoma spectabile]|uniref:cohesin subunit SA-2 isoform X1 n=2 Tax=Etheostoma spectabile TaxID=54343 RepID=UPI0013AEE232|nr:cohesin subunit SA-2-like isoform X1 [Etheostoma spectabile]XP_032383519.1 cohesin subunit SA-2-like isoform X1 [Etheostoma spectabile]XP_032383521.1 cohesin subunit SA-2-like isoform X1 [Etheostoma spectabile]XP_032383522.1 cohesin subunit SA-2-like isoform X1 [Etheostoma spectabile]XP_032383523.1 cohesin subunit SA-2-like isoform X1 [Etheostoma spectabile]XP_032383524.1 cohesin subunit SA-2-like isoform X1 [Etheostoma spectabile]
MASGDSLLDSLEELDDFSDSDSDYEATTKATKRRKQPVTGLQPPKRSRRKAALRVSSPSSSPIPTPPNSPLQQHSQNTSRQASARPVTRVNKGNRGISAEDIYDAVCSGKSAMVTVVDEWLDNYKQSREEGLLVLINFIVQSCGCKGVVSREMLDNMQNAEIISTLTKEFNEDSVNYPLCTPGPQLRRFKASLCEFTRVLVSSCRNSLVFDEYLFPSLLALLTGMSDSQVRAFRHTSTLLAMKLMTGLVEVAVIVSVQLQTTQRQYDMENSKREQDRATDRLEELRATISELRENREEISSMMNATFRGVFVHRYRDRLPEIRAACIQELGIWLKTDPEDFLNDGCLKYLGWTLHDKQSPVRLQCVRALQGLYQEKEFIGRLELFTSRFKERMLSMALDKDPEVAVEVVNLLLLIQQRTEEGLKEEECGHIYPLVYALNRGLASAAGIFLFNKLKSVIASDNQKNDKSENAAFFQILISFYIQSEFHEHGAYLVDSLWDVARSELRDWETMTALLLQEDGLMYEEEGALIELMMCAIRQAAQATPPIGRTQGKKILGMKDKKVQDQDRRRITAHFIPLLPQLLAKYSADAGKVSLLLKAPLYFNLEMYNSAPRLEKYLDLLLSQICGIVEKHTEVTVLEACAQLASTLCSESYTFSSRAHLAFSQLLDGLTECFSTYLSDLLQGTADDDDVYSAATALKRIAALSSAKDPTGWKLFDSCLELLKSRMESRELDKELLVSALKCAAFYLMWAKVNAVNSTPAEGELNRLKKEMRLFCRVCQTCLSVNQTEIRDQAFELLCDLLLLYSTSSARFEPALQVLVHLPSDSLRSEMAAFLLDYVFSESEDAELNVEGEEEMKINLLQRRRNHLSGYCKLVLYGVLELSAATDIFKHYSKYFKDFGDIIKETISKSKLISPIQSAKTVCLSLQQLFSEMLTEDHSRQNLDEIRDLAKRLAMSFGIDLHRVRKPLVALHMDGVRFAFREPREGEEQHTNVTFLEILSEFSFKLLQQDRTQLAEFVKSECPSAALSWPSVRLYQRSLEGRSSSKARKQEGVYVVSTHSTPVAKRKRTTAQGSAASTVRGSWLETSSIHSSLHTPALTSTAQRQPTKPLASKKPSATPSECSDLSEDEFSLESQIRKVKPVKRYKLSSSQSGPTLDQQDLNSHLTLLSLIEDEDAEREEPEIEDYESDSEHESTYTLPSTRHTSTSVLDELFE